MDPQEIYDILKHGSPGERTAFIRSAPDNSFKTAAFGLIGSDNLGIVILGVTNMAMEYCNGREPAFGAALAEATHSLALEIYQDKDDHGGLVPTTLTNLASQHVNALNLLGRSKEVIRFTKKYIPIYEELKEKENLPTLYCANASALLNLTQIDAAEKILKKVDSSLNPGAKIEINRLLKKIKQLKDGIAQVEPSEPSQQTPDLKGVFKDVLDGLGGPNEEIKTFVEKMKEEATRKGLNPEDNEDFQKLLDLLKQGEGILTKNSDKDNEWTMQGRLREATKIFKFETNPAPDKIKASMRELSIVLKWADDHQHMELANDSLWGIYLCHSRQGSFSEAANALISLRTNLEKQRAGITDPFERGGAFSAYPQLFNALCEKLQRAQRYPELLEAIEASKGRGIADILTKQSGKAIVDTDIYSAARRLPGLAKKFKFHYLSYYIDRYNGEAIIHQVVAGKDGKVYGTDPVVLPEKEMDSALENLDPKEWGKISREDPSKVIEDASKKFSVVIEFLDKLMTEGLMEEGEHICYTADENLNNLPLHYLPFRGKRLIDYFSFSRIHNSLQLELILKKNTLIPKKATVFIVPTQQNVKSKKWHDMQLSLSEPARCLESIIPTDLMENKKVSVPQLKKSSLSKSILHFSTHGIFPRRSSKNNPFTSSGTVISNGKSLPDAVRVARGEISHVLSPEKVISSNLNMQNSHVTLMACVSGLSREGLGGDALGLDWALVQAGATSILASHWMVSAADAASFFSLFYNKWLREEKSRGQAFRETIDELRSQHGTTADAHCWAAFSLSGDWR